MNGNNLPMYYLNFLNSSSDGYGSWIKSNKKCAHQIKEWEGEAWQSSRWMTRGDEHRFYIPPMICLQLGNQGKTDSDNREENRRLLHKIRQALRKEQRKRKKKRKHFASGLELRKWLRTSRPLVSKNKSKGSNIYITNEKFDEFFRGVVITGDPEDIFKGMYSFINEYTTMK